MCCDATTGTSQSLDKCIVCSGSGLLLTDACPLCDGEAAFFEEPAQPAPVRFTRKLQPVALTRLEETIASNIKRRALTQFQQAMAHNINAKFDKLEQGSEASTEAPSPCEKQVTQKKKERPKIARELLVDLKPHAKEVRQDPRLAALLVQAKTLSEDCFDEDCSEGCSARGKWRLTILAGLECDEPALLGFIVWKMMPQRGCMSIAKVAVPEAYRGWGFGRELMSWATQYAKTNKEVEMLSLSSLPKAISFYQRIGFKKLHEIKEKSEDENLVPGQFYMEFRVRKGAARASNGGKSGRR